MQDGRARRAYSKRERPGEAVVYAAARPEFRQKGNSRVPVVHEHVLSGRRSAHNGGARALVHQLGCKGDSTRIRPRSNYAKRWSARTSSPEASREDLKAEAVPARAEQERRRDTSPHNADWLDGRWSGMRSRLRLPIRAAANTGPFAVEDAAGTWGGRSHGRSGRIPCPPHIQRFLDARSKGEFGPATGGLVDGDERWRLAPPVEGPPGRLSVRISARAPSPPAPFGAD